MAEEKRYDVDGYETVSKALWDLVNEYPALNGEEFYFASVEEDAGKSFIPVAGAIIESETRDVTEHVTQTCVYPFMLLYKAAGLSENNKVSVKEWLDTIGRWLEKQTVTINGKSEKIAEYPTLTGNRTIKNIERTSPSYLSEVNNDNVETWCISLQVKYVNEFDL